jgi:hypothetical protein
LFVLLHDEGLVLQAAARIADGDWPYREQIDLGTRCATPQ